MGGHSGRTRSVIATHRDRSFPTGSADILSAAGRQARSAGFEEDGENYYDGSI
jgi:hypothetical protein